LGAKLILVLGGARGGKSSYAEGLAQELGASDVLYVATAEARDEEMDARITAHQAGRPQGWRTLEAPSLVRIPLADTARGARVVLIDCLTLLTSNAMLSGEAEPNSEEAEASVEAEVDALLGAVADSEGTWIVVTNEVGLGLVPATPLGRAYRDALGRANQRLAARADEVVLMIAGLPLRLK